MRKRKGSLKGHRKHRRRGTKRSPAGASAQIHQGVGLKPGSRSENQTLTEAAVKIGAALGKADRTAHQLARFGSREFTAITKVLKKSRLRRLKTAAKLLRQSLRSRRS